MSAVNCKILLLAILAAGTVRAQTDSLSGNMLRSGVQDLLTVSSGPVAESGFRTEITDFTSQDVREAAGIVYVITAADIAHAGCRNLEDALMLVPSFAQGRDVDDMIGFAIRGQWSHEGKCQYLLNGMPLNEASYGTFAMGMRFPLENISRIEVIDGPGSVMYGGFAAVGVVNIVTKDIKDEEGVAFVSSVGLSQGSATQKRTHLYGINRIGSGTEIDYSMSLTMGNRFGGKEQLSDGRMLNFRDSTRAQSLNAYFSLRRKNFRGQFYASDYNLQVSDQPYDIVMRTLIASADQRFRVGRKSRLDLTVMHRIQLPWFYGNGASSELNLTNTVDQRTAFNAVLTSKPLKWLSLTSGLQSYADQFKLYVTREGNVFNVNGKDHLLGFDAAFFSEARIRSKYGSLITGVRWEHHSLSGNAGAPRFGYTGVFGPFHAKLLYSAAYKVPAMQNLNTGPVEGTVEREVVWTAEGEVGYRFSAQTHFTLCAFSTIIEKPIVYVYLGTGAGVQDSYLNRASSATEGLEFSLRHSAKNWGLSASASAYRVNRAHTDLPETQLPDSLGDAFLGVPQLKATLIGHLEMGRNNRFGCSAVWLSSSHAYQYADEAQETLTLVRYPAFLKAGLFVEHSFPRIQGFSASVGCNNLLDQRSWVQSTYNNGITSLPNTAREFVFRLEYRFTL
jgi:outer membrane cobalamin receptor